MLSRLKLDWIEELFLRVQKQQILKQLFVNFFKIYFHICSLKIRLLYPEKYTEPKHK